MVGVGINIWEDPIDIEYQLKLLRKSPIWAVYEGRYEKEILSYFEEKCLKSKELMETKKSNMANDSSKESKEDSFFVPPFVRGEGPFVFDADENQYVDMRQGGGVSILGNLHKPLQKDIVKVIREHGPTQNLYFEKENLLALEIKKHMPSIELLKIMNSSGEAVIGAIRLARTFTNKKRIIKIGGSFHGWADEMIYGVDIPGTGAMLHTHGVPKSAQKYVDEVKPNDIKKLKKALIRNKVKGGTAAVIVEAIGPQSGTKHIGFDYNRQVRELCTKHGALMIMDEVDTAFRVSLNGGQGYFGIKPDLTILGNIVSGGYTGAGALGGKKELMEILSATENTKGERPFVGQAEETNYMWAAAGLAAIKEIEKTNACEIAAEAGDKITKGLKKLNRKYGLPFVVYNQGSIIHLECSGTGSYDFSSNFAFISAIKLLANKNEIIKRSEVDRIMEASYLANGIATMDGKRMYTSAQMTEEVVEEIINKFDKVLQMVRPMI